MTPRHICQSHNGSKRNTLEESEWKTMNATQLSRFTV